jgi:hypothetical protein
MTTPPAFKNEAAFRRWVTKRARAQGWLAAHLSNMQVVRRPEGAIAVPDKDAAGFPDLVLVHHVHGLVCAELKMPGRKPDPEQIVWLRALRHAGVRIFVWYPRDLDEIEGVLDGIWPQSLFEEALRDAADLLREEAAS